MALIPHEGLGAPSQKTSLLGGVAQILISPRSSLRLADVGLFVRPKPNRFELLLLARGFESLSLVESGSYPYMVISLGFISAITRFNPRPSSSALPLLRQFFSFSKLLFVLVVKTGLWKWKLQDTLSTHQKWTNNQFNLCQFPFTPIPEWNAPQIFNFS